jgi:hypothetical protein
MYLSWPCMILCHALQYGPMVLREVTVKMVGSNMLSIEGYAAGFDVTFGPLAFVQRHASYAQCLGQPSWLCPCRRHDYHSALVMNLCPLVRCGFTNCPFYVVASFCRNHKTLYLDLKRCQGGPTRQEWRDAIIASGAKDGGVGSGGRKSGSAMTSGGNPHRK